MRRSIAALLTLIALVPAGLLARNAADTSVCRPGSELLYLSGAQGIGEALYPGFADSLASALALPLGDIGYCLQHPVDTHALASDTLCADRFVMHVSYHSSFSEGQPSAVHTALLRVGDLLAGGIQEALAHPLVVLDFVPGDTETFMTVLVRKIVENLRTTHVCHLVVESEPPGARLATDRGLDGTTPVEWILPLGQVEVTASHEKFRTVTRNLDLSTPGNHRYIIDMSRRRFYHSRFMLPTIGAGLASSVCYGLSRFYYREYRNLGQGEARETPGRFGELFDRAKLLERYAGGLLGVAGGGLLLSFWF